MKVHVIMQYICLPRGENNLYNQVIQQLSRCNCVILKKTLKQTSLFFYAKVGFQRKSNYMPVTHT
jgi:hypothetical protein